MFYKYPKTMHLPWSPGLQNDDRLIQSLAGFEGKEVVITEKMDGENASLYANHYHARSLDSRHHASRDWIKAFHGSIKHLIPSEHRICGENLYAKHSVGYENLPSYFMGFSIWRKDFCLDWDSTLEGFEYFGIQSVPILWRGQWENFPKEYINFFTERCDEVEGYVIRTTDGFMLEDFQSFVAKYVRKDHIQTDQHWMAGPVIPNGLAKCT